MEFIFYLFVICVGGCWLIFKGISSILFGKEKETYIDKSVHYHITNHKHDHKHISIIDDATKKKIFELKESNDDYSRKKK